MTMQEEALFDLIELDADICYKIRDAKNAAIIITSHIGHFPKEKRHQFTLWFGRGIERWSFGTRKEAEAKALEILNKPKTDIKVSVEYPRKHDKDYVFYVKGKAT